ncbi:MAG TPA: hypothetical protein VKA15_16860 [Isosphaeraceae bacterium]|nr:hypothetical protein [Isosphaeraceae bacterium]
MKLLAGLLLAFVSAVTLNWGFFVQHRASNTLERLSMRHPWTALRLLFTNTRWVLGYVVGLGGWGLYIAALLFAPISLVQAVSAGGIGLLAIFVWRVARVRFSRREQAAIGASITGLVFLCISFAAGVPRPVVAGTHTVIIWISVMLLGAGLAWRPGSRLMRPGAGLGVAAGLCYAAGDVSTKGAVSGIGLFLIPVLVVCHLLGFVALQLAFQRGSALATAGLSTLLNNAIPITAGVVAFHERLPSGPFGVARATGFVLVVLGAALLARPEQPAVEATGGGSDAPVTSYSR